MGKDSMENTPLVTSPIPVVICPYVREADMIRARHAFHVDDPKNDVPFSFWQDIHRVGPERAYEHCWNQFPERDVIIVHTDMAPMPDDSCNSWYHELVAFASQMPEAGMIACDLLYPIKSPQGHWYVQCAGGNFCNGEVGYVGGGVDVRASIIHDTAREYTSDFNRVREVEWVTFGGVLIRRQVIRACGPIDRRYRWAYYMDVDYSLEALVRGFRLFQVPVKLLHEEQGTTHDLLRDPAHQSMLQQNRVLFSQKWAGWLDERRIRRIPSSPDLTPARV